MRAYALIQPDTNETPGDVVFGWAPKLADLLLQWQGWKKEARTDDEIAATIEALQSGKIDVWGYRMIEAQHKVVQEAAWACDLEDVAIYYEGPQTDDEYEIRQWVAAHVKDNTVRHVLLDELVPLDRHLDDPQLVDKIHQQIDETD